MSENWLKIEEGLDVTDILGVKKWEIPLAPCLKGDALGLFPSFIPKTDEERWQNLSPRDYRYHGDDEFEVTVKMDGQSMTVYHNNEHNGVCSRNLEIKESEESLQWRLVHDLNLIRALIGLNLNIAIQGELCGPGIQNNRMKLNKHRFFVFNVWDIDNKRYYRSDERSDLINDLRVEFNVHLDHVDIVKNWVEGIPDLVNTLNSLVKDIKYNGQGIEGVVYKSLDDPSFSWKFINPEYLLKEKD